jgi:hypothetical protein
MDFLTDPDAYDVDRSWRRAVVEVGGDRAEALDALAHACADSPIATPDMMRLARRVVALSEQLDGPEWIGAVTEMHAELSTACDLVDAFPVSAPEDDLASEVAPWAAAARTEAEVGITALRLIQASRPVATIDVEGDGWAAAPDPETGMRNAFRVLFAWKGIRADQTVVFGPRFAIYTPIVQLADGAPAVDAGAALRENANAIDALCRLALRTYDAWRFDAAEPLRVFAGTEERACAPDGSFDGRGGPVTVRQGRAATTIAPGTTFPFSDRRLP